MPKKGGYKLLKLQKPGSQTGKWKRGKALVTRVPAASYRAQASGRTHSPNDQIAADRPDRTILVPGDYPQDTGHEYFADDEAPDTAAAAPACRTSIRAQGRRHSQRARNAEDARVWRAQEEEIFFASVCAATADETLRAEKLQHAKSDWAHRLAAASGLCPLCGATDSLAETGSWPVTFVTSDVQCQVHLPHWKCSECAGQPTLSGPSFRCLPATLQKPTVFFDWNLLELVHTLRMHGPVSMQTVSQTFGWLHREHGTPGKPSIFRKLGLAVRRFGAIRRQLQSNKLLGVEEINPGGHLSPYCRSESCTK